MDWFYADGQSRVGPVTETAFREAVMTGKVTADTLVWHEGMGEWQPYGTVTDQLPAAAGAADPSAAETLAAAVPAMAASRAADPYAAPAAALHDASAGASGSLLPSPRSVGGGEAIEWLSYGWEGFKQQPGLWIITSILVFGVLFGLNLIPFIGPIIGNVLYFLMLSGIFLMVANQERGEAVSVGDVFEGFNHRPGPILGTLGLYFLGAMILGFVFGGMMVVIGNNQNLMIAMAVVLFIVFLPLGMSIAYAPVLLTMHQEVGAIEAMKMSFFGCLRNILPLIVWSLLLIPLSIVAMIPCGLGLLVLMPVMLLSMYASYKSIYLQPA